VFVAALNFYVDSTAFGPRFVKYQKWGLAPLTIMYQKLIPKVLEDRLTIRER